MRQRRVTSRDNTGGNRPSRTRTRTATPTSLRCRRRRESRRCATPRGSGKSPEAQVVSADSIAAFGSAASWSITREALCHG